MNKVRIGIAWVFGDISNFFYFLDFKKNLKIGLSSIGKMYVVSALLMNFGTYLYTSISSKNFSIDAQTINEYLV